MVQKMRKMKDSGIEWIGEIPEGWEVTKLKYLSTFPIEKNTHIDSPYIGLENIESWTGKYVSSDSQYDKSQALTFSRNNILFGKLRPYLAKVFCASNDGCCSSEFCILNFSSPVNIRYFWNLLISPTFIDHVTKSTYGTKMPRANTDFIKNICVPVPPRIEQDRIALYLDATSAKIDSLISETRSSIEEYKKLKQAIITQAVTKGVRGEREMKDSGVEWIGEINHRFSLIKLKYICSILDQYRKPISADKRSQSGSILYDYYGASGAIDKIDDYTIDDHVMLIGEDGANLRMRNLPLMYEVNGKAWINNHAHILKPTERVDFYYLFYSLEGLDINPYITGSAQPKLSQEKLQNIWVPLPDFEEQQEIATYIRSKCAEIDGVIAKKELLVKELESYKKSLIYEVVTGKREV